MDNGKTGLTPEAIPKIGASPLPFPDMMLPLLPRQSGFTPVRRACVAALLMTTVAGVAALCLSATANRSLLLQVSDDLHKYDAVPADNDAAKAHHLSVLKDDANILDSYFREGSHYVSVWAYIPANGYASRYGGLFAITVHLRKRDVADALPVQSVRLDSMALFDVGQARLKDGSTKVLINALVNIRARPGWLIVVTGYTDTTGNKKPISNCRCDARKPCATGCYRPATFRPPVLPYRGWAKAILRQLTIRRKAGPLTGASKSVWFPALTPVRT